MSSTSVDFLLTWRLHRARKYWAGELKADLIVMETHGHGNLTHFFFGSVAEYVVRHSTIPVLTVRQNAVRPAA